MKSKILALSTNEEFKILLKQKKISNKYVAIFFGHLKDKNKKMFNDWKMNILNENCNLIKINKKLLINNVSINSNNIKKNDIFFGIKGANKDGNNFSDHAIEKGAAFCVVNRIKEKNKKKIKVKNTLKILTDSAKVIRQVSLAKFISITGSSGKTSLKELLAYSLNKLSPTAYSLNSFNKNMFSHVSYSP